MQGWFTAHYEILKDFAGPATTVIGIIVTAVIAFFGFQSFERWRREKIEERRIDVALDALALAYEASFRFEAIRARGVGESEYADIDQMNEEYPVRHREAQRAPYAVIKRISDSQDYFDRIEKIEPRFMAVFGAETKAIFALLYQARQRVEASAGALYDEGAIEHDPSDQNTRERLRKLRIDVFASPGEVRPEDIVGQMLLDFQRRIEALCRPIVDQTFG